MTKLLYKTICSQHVSPTSSDTIKSSPCSQRRLSPSVAEAEPPRQPSRGGSSRSLEIESQTLLPGKTLRNITGRLDTNAFYRFSLPGVKIQTFLSVCHKVQGAEDHIPLAADRHVYCTVTASRPPPTDSAWNNTDEQPLLRVRSRTQGRRVSGAHKSQ